MVLLDDINSDPKQSLSFVLPNNQEFNISIEYSQQQVGWYCSITFGDLTINNIRIVNSPNLLRQWRNIIPFGLQVVSTDGVDPVDLFDFERQRSRIYVLDSDEVELIEENIIV